jgi:hypothetical protein
MNLLQAYRYGIPVFGHAGAMHGYAFGLNPRVKTCPTIAERLHGAGYYFLVGTGFGILSPITVPAFIVHGTYAYVKYREMKNMDRRANKSTK